VGIVRGSKELKKNDVSATIDNMEVWEERNRGQVSTLQHFIAASPFPDQTFPQLALSAVEGRGPLVPPSRPP